MLLALLPLMAFGQVNWITPAQVKALPMSGPAWEQVWAHAQLDASNPDPSNAEDPTDQYAYAKALVYVRTGIESYRVEVIESLQAAQAADWCLADPDPVRPLCINFVSYVIAAELVGHDVSAWVSAMRSETCSDAEDMAELSERRPNNIGLACGAARLVADLYLGQGNAAAREVFLGWLDGSWPHEYGIDCWRVGVSPPRGINPAGHEWDGVLPDDQRRSGCPPETPCGNYVRAGLGYALVQAQLLGAWQHADSAMHRAYQWVHDVGCDFSDGNDQWQVPLVNAVYGTDFPAWEPAGVGKMMGYTDWTHADPTSPPPPPPPPPVPCEDSDYDADGVVGTGDLAALLGSWGRSTINDLLALLHNWGCAYDVPGEGGVKIAFIGDQGLGSESEAVLDLVLAEGAEALVILGDLDYDDNPLAWSAQLQDRLGICFPVFAVVGNHEDNDYQGYLDAISALLECNGIQWHGLAGDQYSFTYRGVYFVFSSPGLFGGPDAASYVAQRLATPEAQAAIWRVSGFHVLMEAMQVGGKSDESGWDVYENSRLGGAIVATAHEHSYARTNLLSDMSAQVVAGQDLVVSEGETFAFHSGLGGRSIRDQERCFPEAWPYGCGGVWASIYTGTQGADYGALFIEFGYQGDPSLARGYFKAINGDVPDEFMARSAN